MQSNGKLQGQHTEIPHLGDRACCAHEPAGQREPVLHSPRCCWCTSSASPVSWAKLRHPYWRLPQQKFSVQICHHVCHRVLKYLRLKLLDINWKIWSLATRKKKVTISTITSLSLWNLLSTLLDILNMCKGKTNIKWYSMTTIPTRLQEQKRDYETTFWNFRQRSDYDWVTALKFYCTLLLGQKIHPLHAAILQHTHIEWFPWRLRSSKGE